MISHEYHLKLFSKNCVLRILDYTSVIKLLLNYSNINQYEGPNIKAYNGKTPLHYGNFGTNISMHIS